MPFEPNKNAKELGIDKTRKFVVVENKKGSGNLNVNIGDILICNRDDTSFCPYFDNLTTNKKGIGCYWYRLNYADNKLNKTFMSTLTEKFVLAFVGEPEKSFRKTGIINGDNILTDEGAKIFLTWLLQKEKEAFKKECVDGILEEQEKEKK